MKTKKDDIIDLMRDNDFLNYYTEKYKNTILLYKKNLNIMEKQNLDFLNDFDLALDKDDFNLFIKRFENRLSGVLKMKKAFDEGSPTASIYKLYYLYTIAEYEHWYKTSIDSEDSVSKAQGCLSSIDSKINYLNLTPDEHSWNNLREKLPEIFYDIKKNIAQARNYLEYHLQVDLNYEAKDIWIFSRTAELFNTVEFENPDNEVSDITDSLLKLHPTDAFVRKEIPKEEWSERIIHRDILLENFQDIKEMTDLKFRKHVRLEKMKQNKNSNFKP